MYNVGSSYWKAFQAVTPYITTTLTFRNNTAIKCILPHILIAFLADLDRKIIHGMKYVTEQSK